MGARRRRAEDVGPTDLLAVRAALVAGATPTQALDEVICPTLDAVRRAVAAGVPLARIAADDPDLPPAASSLVRVMAVAELAGAPAVEAVDAVQSAVDQQSRLQATVRVRSAQAVLSARFLTGLPVLGALALVAVDADARRVLVGPLGVVLVGAAGMLIAVAVLWMRRLLHAVARAGTAADPLLPDRPPRRATRRAADRPVVDLPTAEVIDLVALALSAGLGLAEAVRTAATVGPTATRPALDRTARSLAVGVAPRDAFPDGLAEAAHLIDITHRWGAPTAEALRVLATELRDRAATAAETAAERLTVHLIFPTTTLLVPAFALLVVVPTVAAMLGGPVGVP